MINEQKQQTLLVVDDDLHILEVLEARLSSAGFAVHKASRAQEALTILKQRGADLLISDMKMPGMGGLSLLSEVQSRFPGLPVIILTAYGTIPDAVRAVKAGAVEYLTKPFDGRELLGTIRTVLSGTPQLSQAPAENLAAEADEGLFASESPAMGQLYDLVERVAASHVNVLLLGESGAGKECVARLIHDLGSRKEAPFVVVDCGATPTGLLESELFGHVRGSFTHAVRDKTGLIEMADRGTLFLDEIGNISPEMQVRLLRFLEERKIRKVGGLKEKAVDCRVVAATNANLVEEIRAGRFREDLYYRLKVVTLKIPPLRERQEDIPSFIRYFFDLFRRAHGVSGLTLPPETVRWLCEHPWPGNVRELKNAMEAGIVLCRDGVLQPSDFNLSDELDAAKAPPREKPDLSLEESERHAIIRALKEAGGVQKSAADLLGISRRAICYKVKKYGIDASQIRSEGAG